MNILIVEDEEELLSSILKYLQEEQFNCNSSTNLKDALSMLKTEPVDCCIIDIGLPDGSGLDLVKTIKEEKPEARIIIISARNSTDNKVEGLNFGADDYLTKPFDLSELNARINAALRRYQPKEAKEIHFKEIKIIPDTFQVFINSSEVMLTKKEYDLLVYLISNLNKVISKHAMAEHLWGKYEDSQESFDFLYAQVKNLRKKIAAAGGKNYIHNINRIGYKFRDM